MSDLHQNVSDILDLLVDHDVSVHTVDCSHDYTGGDALATVTLQLHVPVYERIDLDHRLAAAEPRHQPADGDGWSPEDGAGYIPTEERNNGD